MFPASSESVKSSMIQQVSSFKIIIIFEYFFSLKSGSKDLSMLAVSACHCILLIYSSRKERGKWRAPGRARHQQSESE